MRYKNIDEFKSPGPIDFIKWRTGRILNFKKIEYKVPTVENVNLKKIMNPGNDIQVTWLGHSTFLIQINGVNILTDPVFSKFMGNVKRLTYSETFPKELPEINYVLISHGHYDHLSFPSIKKLKGKPTYIVPIGLGKLFRRRGLKDVVELEWYDNYLHKGLKFNFVPARHWHRRGVLDNNKSLWGGFVVESDNNKGIYFAGDSGYFSGFKTIGEKFNIKYALMPIGCFAPEWFMYNQHMSPEEAVKAFKDIGAEVFIPMHYDSYLLADDHPKEALDRLNNCWDSMDLNRENLRIMKIDETILA